MAADVLASAGSGVLSTLFGVFRILGWVILFVGVGGLGIMLGINSQYKHKFLIRDLTGEVPVLNFFNAKKTIMKDGTKYYKLKMGTFKKSFKIQYPPKTAVAFFYKKKPTFIVTKYSDSLYQYMEFQNIKENENEIHTILKTLNQDTLDFVFHETVIDAEKIAAGNKNQQIMQMIMLGGIILMLLIVIGGMWFLLGQFKNVIVQMQPILDSVAKAASQCQQLTPI